MTNFKHIITALPYSGNKWHRKMFTWFDYAETIYLPSWD